jgi:hypothetical protein
MAKQFYVNIDLNQNQLLNSLLQVLATDPATPLEGQLWYNSDALSKKIKFYNGTDALEVATVDELHEHSNKTVLDSITNAGSGSIITTVERNKLTNIAAGADVNQNAFSTFSDGTNTASADTETDTFTLRSANNLLDVVVTNDDATYGDNAIFTVNEANISHSNLSNLTNDDHEQYILVDGTRAFTGPVGGVTPSAGADLATKDYVDSLLQGLDWQESVIDRDLASPPGTPAEGDRYLVASGASGDWAGYEGYIAEWDGAAWIFSSPDEGFCAWVEDENIQVTYNGTGWVTFGSTTNHSALSGLQGGDTGEYYHLTAAQHTDLTDGGDSTSHYHASDRNLANATGILAVANGGTNNASYTTSKFLVYDGTKLASSAYDSSSFATAGHDHDTEYLGLHATADNADLLDNQDGTYYLNWNNFSNIPASFTPSSHGNEVHDETFITASGVTFENLDANGDVGSGAAQVAPGDHTHANMTFKYSATIGDGVSTALDVTHNLGTRDTTIQIYRNTSPYDEIMCDIEHTDLNTTTFKFAQAPTTDEFRVVIVG